MKDYDFSLQYHPNKANIVANALSRKRLHVGFSKGKIILALTTTNNEFLREVQKK